MNKQKTRPSVDAKSFDLAEHFLANEPNTTEDDRWSLAAAIQEAVENWFGEQEA